MNNKNFPLFFPTTIWCLSSFAYPRILSSTSFSLAFYSLLSVPILLAFYFLLSLPILLADPSCVHFFLEALISKDISGKQKKMHSEKPQQSATQFFHSRTCYFYHTTNL